MSNKMDLDRIAFIGRTYLEYVHIFGLDEAALKRGPILDCPSGASSFAAEARQKGCEVTACDLLYAVPPYELIRKAHVDTDYALSQAYKAKGLYNWDFYGGVEAHREQREKALDIFAADFPIGLKEGRYIPAELPRLPFKDKGFSLVLSGHFLFLYADRLGFDFHLEALRELMRVGLEVRVFPIIGLDAKPYPKQDELIGALRQTGIGVEVIKVPFEFMKGGDRMLRLTHCHIR